MKQLLARIVAFVAIPIMLANCIPSSALVERIPGQENWPACDQYLANETSAQRQVSSALQSSLSHPSDPQAIQKDIESLETARKDGKLFAASIAADQALSLMKQLQKNPEMASTKEFTQEVQTLNERLEALRVEAEGTWGRCRR